MKKAISFVLCILLSILMTACDIRVPLKEEKASDLYLDALSKLQNFDLNTADSLLIVGENAQKRISSQVTYNINCSVSQEFFDEVFFSMVPWSQQQDPALVPNAWKVRGVGYVGFASDTFDFCVYTDGTYYFHLIHPDIANGAEVHCYLYPTPQRVDNASSQYKINWQ